MPRAPLPSVTLAIEDPKVVAFLASRFTCSALEVLRRFGRAISSADLAQAMRCKEGAVQRAIDLLAELELVSRVTGASETGAARVRYRAAADALIVVFDAQNAAQISEIDRIASSLRDMASDDPEPGREAANRSHIMFEYARPVSLDPDRLAQLNSLLAQAQNLLEQTASATRVGPQGQGVFCTHQVTLEILACRPETLPIPQIRIVPRAEAEAARESIGGAGMKALSVRERTVALALAAGKTRPAIASELGLSINTIASVNKRIYAKLRVRSRAALANHLRG